METRRLAIDTDVVVDFLRRGDGTLPLALQYFDCTLTAIVAYEWQAVSSPVRQQVALEQILRRVNVQALDMEASQRAASLWRSLAEGGRLIGAMDILSAAVRLDHDLPLLTRNVDHYRRVPGLRVITPDELAGQVPTV